MKEENKDSPWTKLPIKVDLNISLTRKTLIEKFSLEAEMMDFFISKINNCELFIHKDYKNSLFYFQKIGKEKKIILEKHEENKYYYIRYGGFWEVFETKYGLQYKEIQSFTEHALEGLLNSKGYKTSTEL